MQKKKSRNILRVVSEKNRQLMIFRDFQESLLTRMYFKLAKKKEIPTTRMNSFLSMQYIGNKLIFYFGLTSLMRDAES